MKKKKKGLFIVIEGGDGSGKGTQVKRLVKKLEEVNQDVILTREPGGTEIGEEIREIILKPGRKMFPRTEVLLFCASRAQHIDEKVKPALEQGKIVVSDRFSGSTFAYQYYGRKLTKLGKMKMIDDFARKGLEPDLVIYLDVPVEIGLKRVEKDEKLAEFTRIDQEEIKFHQRVRQGYLKLAAQKKNWLVIDATLSREEIHQKVWQVVKKYLGR